MKSLVEYINEAYITEMAANMSDFRHDVTNISFQIIENWCLVRWAEMYPEHHLSVNRNHWASELKGHLRGIVKTRLKSGRKDKVIKSVMLDSYEFQYDDSVADTIRKKFNDEGLSKYINIMAHEFTKNVTEVCNIMSSNNEEDIDDYVSKPIG